MLEQHLIFKGIVQGVGFRFKALQAANELKLKGTVKNLADGSVEVYLQGEPQEIALKIADYIWCFCFRPLNRKS